MQVEPWRDVESVQDFVSYLRLLADECARAVGDGDGDPSAQSWTNRSINDFLWAWSPAVRRLLETVDSAHDHDQPGWRGLAFQLHLARMTKPGFNCVFADSGLRCDEVDSALHLQMHLAALATGFACEQREIAERTRRGDSALDAGSWVHRRLDAFLHAWAAWLEGACLKPLPSSAMKSGIERPPVEPVTWRSIAFQLDAARTYE